MSIALVVGILGISAVLTNMFARGMYNRCPSCGNLNAKRRLNCRICNHKLYE
jgi:hypothetical protein